jgi:hypothetical protein
LSLPVWVPTVCIFSTFCLDAKDGAQRSRRTPPVPKGSTYALYPPVTLMFVSDRMAVLSVPFPTLATMLMEGSERCYAENTPVAGGPLTNHYSIACTGLPRPKALDYSAMGNPPITPSVYSSCLKSNIFKSAISHSTFRVIPI